MDLAAKIEAILFYRAEPVEIKELAKSTNSSPEQVTEAIKVLKEKLADSGLCLLELNNQIELGTNPELSGLIEQLVKEELARDLGKAALETLTLIVYQGPVSRQEIDQVRGVNSSFILRHLLVRGLVERVIDDKDARRYLYQPTMELLRYLGIEKVEELPEYEIVQAELKSFLTTNKNGGEIAE